MPPSLPTGLSEGRSRLRGSLQLRILLLVLVINAVVLGGGAVFLAMRLSAASSERYADSAEDLVYTLRGTIQPEGELNVARILSWPSWSEFDDALLVDVNWVVGSGGIIVPRGVRLNPLGSSRRSAGFDEQGILQALAQAVATGNPVTGVEGGRAVPVRHPGGVWGGCWFRIDRSDEDVALLRLFGVAFLGSTILLSGATFFVLRRTVLDPVRSLARAARAVAAGDLAVHVGESDRRDELSDLVRTFNSMTGQVRSYNTRLEREVRRATEKALRAEAAAMTQRRLAATGELAAGIAHEINNPLGGLQNAVEALAEGRLSEPKRAQYLELLKNGLERIQSTVGQLLRFTPREVATGPVLLSRTIADAVALVAHRAARLGFAVRLGAGEPGLSPEEVERRHAELPTIEGQAHELSQAVLNLLVNALDALEEAARASGTVDVDLTQVGDEQRIVVADDGPGVPDEDLSRIADLYYTTKDVGKGTGLGLAIVHTVVAHHGGTVHLSRSRTGGLSVSIHLPITGSSREEQPGAGAESRDSGDPA